MLNVKDHYEKTAIALNANTGWSVQNQDGSDHVTILGKISYSIEENVRYWSVYFPNGATLAHIEYILRMPETAQCTITDDIQTSQIIGFTDSPERHSLDSLKFSGRVYLYIDQRLTPATKQIIINIGNSTGLSVMIRDQQYVDQRSELSRPLAFISHDSRDKDSLVRELANELSTQLCPVWYDEYSLKVGDNLRESIERGLKESKKCIVVLSPNFISNKGWSKVEFDSIFTREIYEKNSLILPIWHNVSSNEVYQYCPSLLNKFALSSDIGIKKLAVELSTIIKG